MDAARDQTLLLVRSPSGSAGPAAATPRQMLDRASATMLEDLDHGRRVDPLLLSVLAELYVQFDAAKAAEPLLTRALAMAETQGAAADAARARQSLAAIRLSEGRLADASALLDTARAVWDRDPVRYGRDRIEAEVLSAFSPDERRLLRDLLERLASGEVPAGSCM